MRARLQKREAAFVNRVRKGERVMLRACAALVLDDARQRPRDGRLTICSGVIVELGAHTIFLTAAHCIEIFDDLTSQFPDARVYLRVPRASGAVRIDYPALRKIRFPELARLLDEGNLASEATRSTLPGLMKLDVGFVVLTGAGVDGLRSAGCCALQRDHIRLYETDEALHLQHKQMALFLFGAPKNAVRVDPSAEPTMVFKSLRLLVTSAPASPRIILEPGWSAREHTGSISGMSGGPITVLGLAKPIVTAIQSEESILRDVTELPSTQHDPGLLWAADHSKVVDLIEAILQNTP